ncbi:MAG TPA: multiheme c-type cytochrome, partial [Geobacteraceae bacterium]|nr:multiheme c-type cytochrome [Geobacteraceae bacterium]
RGEARVDMKACAPCHKKAFDTHRQSRHGMGLHSGWGCTRNLENRNQRECAFCHDKDSAEPLSSVQCARFLKQSAEMGEVGCNYCHSVESSCASCHTNHNTDLKIVRDPASCAKCHMGPDHPQWEMWQTSQHGTLYATAGASLAPDCQRCHMPGGSHDVSVGITMSSGGIPYPAGKAAPNREAMVKICSECHAPNFASRELARGDAIQKQSIGIVKEAEKIIFDLSDRRLLDPMPEDRPPHPLSGNTLVIDSQLLYEDTSHIERLLFKMKKYDYARTIKGAYHQNPAYTHWYGNAELKMDLVDIRAEASRLRKAGTGPAPETKAAPAEGEGLKVLKRKLERGGITPEEYEVEKKKLLDEHLGGKKQK